MRYRLAARQTLDDQLRRLRAEHVLELHLAVPTDLLREPDADPVEMPTAPPRAGIDDLASILLAARRLPSDLTVQVVVLSGDTEGTGSVADIESTFRRVAFDRSVVAWRDGIAQRAMGLRQLPAGLVIAAISWVAAYAFGYLATEADGAGVGLLAVSAMIAITIAWVVSWMVVETTLLDWRLDGRPHTTCCQERIWSLRPGREPTNAGAPYEPSKSQLPCAGTPGAPNPRRESWQQEVEPLAQRPRWPHRRCRITLSTSEWRWARRPGAWCPDRAMPS